MSFRFRLFPRFAFAAALLAALPASAQMRSFSCTDADSFFGAVYAPGWDYISGYGSAADCANACWGMRSCEAYYCATIGYCVALHAGPVPGGTDGGAVGPSRSDLPFAAACGFDSECRSGECFLGFCQ
jgi:hypothetical protein